MKKQNKKNIYNLSPEEVLKKYKTSLLGISESEVEIRLKEFGYNKIEKKAKWRIAKLIFAQFNDALVWILLVAALLALAFGEYRDASIILIIVAINAIIGFSQEFKAERIMDSIKKLTTDKAVVIRKDESEGRMESDKKEIDTKNIVPGDIIFISPGDNVPADGYILESYDLRVNSFIFTGESKPKNKSSRALEEIDIPLADRTNMLFMGETVATGEAKFVVIGTGMNTELGRIAHLTEEVKDEATPLQKQMRVLGRDVTILAVSVGMLVIIAGQYFNMSLYHNFLFALALAVSVVPEGLPAAISVALSYGMKKLIKDNVLVKKLSAVETLGSVSLICTDKTGTITKNELTVTEIAINNQIIDITGVGYEPEGDFYIAEKKINQREIKNLDLLFKIGTLCNNASLVKEGEYYKILGDPTEGALIVAGRKYDGQKGYFEKGERKINELPFSSERMRMSVIYENSETISFVKGSPDVILNLCTKVNLNGKIEILTAERKEEIRKVYNQMSAKALRVLAFAYRKIESGKADILDKAEENLIWVGMMAMIDPPRTDVGKAIAECRELGIKVVMITGDYEVTARAIAEKIGLISEQKKFNSEQYGKNSNQDFVINGKTLNTLRDADIYRRVKNGVCIFARIAPEQKLRIAKIFKKYGEVIAMTGDGVNDAPALKCADIGVAMGMIGTDVSKQASDMILMNDNFASIVKGVLEGRTIFSNLKKFVHYVFTSNASELFTVIFGVILHIPSPISAIQILAVDLGTDIFPSFALGFEPAEKTKTKQIINSKRKVMDAAGFRRIIYLGILMATGAVITFLWSMMRGGWDFGNKIDANAVLYIKSTTAAYAVISMTQMANLLQSRSEKLSPFQLGFFKNGYIIGSIFISIGMLLLFMYLPFCQKYLGMLPIDRKDWLAVAVSFLAVFLWEEARKEKRSI